MSPYLASWLSLAEGRDAFTNELRFDVRHLVLSDSIASLDARETATGEPAVLEALYAAEVRLVARVLALGLARVDDPRVERIAELLRQRINFEPATHSGHWITMTLQLASTPPPPINLIYGSVADPELPEVALAAIALTARGLALRGSPPIRETGPGCMGPAYEEAVWTPASTAAIAIALGADPEVVLRIVEDGVREMIALARGEVARR